LNGEEAFNGKKCVAEAEEEVIADWKQQANITARVVSENLSRGTNNLTRGTAS
jgi:hypothetical protein